jgi:hypothetical protein
MSSISDATRSTQDQLLAAVKQSQKAVVDAVGAWAKAVENAVPAVPAAAAGVDLPKPEEVVESAFDYAEKLLKAQREFAKDLIAAAGPVLEKAEQKKTPVSTAK